MKEGPKRMRELRDRDKINRQTTTLLNYDVPSTMDSSTLVTSALGDECDNAVYFCRRFDIWSSRRVEAKPEIDQQRFTQVSSGSQLRTLGCPDLSDASLPE